MLPVISALGHMYAKLSSVGQLFTIFKKNWAHLGQLGELLRQFVAFLGQFVSLEGKLEAIFGQFWGKLCHYWGNCDTFGAILDLLGQFGALLGQFVAVLEGFNILIYTGIYAFVSKGFNDFLNRLQ